jgi:hypothetical protein
MKPAHAAVLAIWLIVVFSVVLLSPIQGLEAAQLPAIAIIFPVAFFTAAAFWLPGYPFDVVPLRLWIDEKKGDGSYAEFIRQVKPMLFFGVSGLVGAMAGFLRDVQAQPPIEALRAQGFWFSGAAGFLLAREILAKRGLSMESEAASGSSAENSPATPEDRKRGDEMLGQLRRIAKWWVVIGTIGLIFSLTGLVAHFVFGVPVHNGNTGQLATSQEVGFVGTLLAAGFAFAAASGTAILRWLKKKRN